MAIEPGGLATTKHESICTRVRWTIVVTTHNGKDGGFTFPCGKRVLYLPVEARMAPNVNGVDEETQI